MNARSHPMSPAPLTPAVAQAYQQALAARAERIARGARPRGFKIGFTNRNIWPRYKVFGPIWGTVWDSTLSFCDGEGQVSLAGTSEPRIEPEAVFGIAATPPLDPTAEQLFDCIEWVAPGFEVVQPPSPGWRFTPEQTVAFGGLHAHLLVGPRRSVREVAPDADALQNALALAGVRLAHGDDEIDRGVGANVLGNPLQALRHFVAELRACPGAPDLQPGDVVTTGTWTDAWAVAPGEHWTARFDAPLVPLAVSFT